MRWVAIFHDKPAMLAIRKERGARHPEYLRRHENGIIIAGGLRDAPDGTFIGVFGCWK